MSRLPLPFALLLALLLASCAAPSPFTPTPTPTETLTSTPTPTPTETPIPTPEPITLTGTFGLAPEVAVKFAGAERYIRRAENGTYLVTAFYRDPQTKKLTPLELELLPDTFSDHPEIKNPLAPLTVVGRLKADPSQPRFSIISSAPAPTETPTTPTPTHHSDQEDFLEYILPPKNTNFLLDDQDFWPKAEGRVPSIEEMPIYGPLHEDYKLIWTGKEFRLAYTFPALFEGVGSENPRLLQENLEKIPFIPIEDIQSGLAAQSVLLAMQESGYQPFSENTRLGENRLRFELRNNGLKTAELLSLANLDLKLDVNHHPIKVTPFLFKSQLNGQDVLVSSIAILNPADHENWSPDEFIVTFGINYPEIETQSFAKFFQKGSHFLINSLYLYATNPNLDPNDPNTIVIPNPNNPDNPTLLDARDPFQSLLAQLLSIEGNDASRMEWEGAPTIDLQVNINHWINQIDNSNRVAEVPFYPDTAPSKLQQMLFPFEVGVAQ